MAKKAVSKTDNSVIGNMLAFIKEIASAHNVSEDEVASMLSDCIVKAYTKENQDQQLEAKVDLKKQEINMRIPYEVVSEDHVHDYDDYNQILINDPRIAKADPKYQVGDIYWNTISINDLSRKVITLIIQGFKQKISEIDYTKIANEYKDQVGTIILGEVDEYSRNGEYIIKIADNVYGGLAKNEQNPGEKLPLGSRMAFYLDNVKAQTRDWPLILSRKSKALAEYYLTLVVPEIRDGDIQVREVARSAGFKSKIAVSSTKFASNIGSPAAICVGKEGSRVKEISRYLGGEPVEIMNWYANPLEFIINCVGASKIIGLCFDELETEHRIILVVKPEAQSLVIGRRGLNIRLCSELTHYNLDVKTPDEMRMLDKVYHKTKDVLDHVEDFIPTPDELQAGAIKITELETNLIENLNDVTAKDFGLDNDFMDKVSQDARDFEDDLDENDELFDNNEYLDELSNDFQDEIDNVKKAM